MGSFMGVVKLLATWLWILMGKPGYCYVPVQLLHQQHQVFVVPDVAQEAQHLPPSETTEYQTASQHVRQPRCAAQMPLPYHQCRYTC